MATKAKLTLGPEAWEGSNKQSTQSEKYIFKTKDKFVTKDIEFEVSSKEAGKIAIKGGELTHGEILTGDNTYLQNENNGLEIIFSNTAAINEISQTLEENEEGWVSTEKLNYVKESQEDTKTLTKYIKKGSAKVEDQTIVVNPMIFISNGNIVARYSGSKEVSGAITPGWVDSMGDFLIAAFGKTSVPATNLDPNLKQENIISGQTIFGITGTASASDTSIPASFANVGTEGIEYDDISNKAPVLISGDYLYINEGYIGNKKISLSQLIPDEANLKVADGASYILSGKSAYDSEGNLISGTMKEADITPGNVDVSINRVGDLNSSTDKEFYPIEILVEKHLPIVNTPGYIGGDDIDEDSITPQITTVSMEKAKILTSGGDLQAGEGSSSININGYFDGVNVSEADTIELSTVATAGYYKIGTVGKGSVTRKPVKSSNTEGYLKATDEEIMIESASLDSKEGINSYYIKKSTGVTSSLTPDDNSHTITISAGYYPEDRTITLEAIDYSKLSEGELDISNSVISSIVELERTPVVDTENWKYTIPLTVTAAGNISIEVENAGYLKKNKKITKDISKESNINVNLDMFDGTYYKG